MYKRRNNTQNNKKQRIRKIESKHTKQDNKLNKNVKKRKSSDQKIKIETHNNDTKYCTDPTYSIHCLGLSFRRLQGSWTSSDCRVQHFKKSCLLSWYSKVKISIQNSESSIDWRHNYSTILQDYVCKIGGWKTEVPWYLLCPSTAVFLSTFIKLCYFLMKLLGKKTWQ